MNRVVLLTGSNVGNSVSHLFTAEQLITDNIGEIERASNIYKTAPWGNTHQNVFLNQVMLVNTPLSAHEVLKQILILEAKMGRVRTKKWEPRVIDIDVLFFNNDQIQTNDLTVPHPLLHLRKFTLVPLAEIYPNFVHPVFQKSIYRLLADCKDDSNVEKL